MRPGIVQTIYRKEMLDLLRDRRTLISMVVVPVLVFPLLITAGGRIVASLEKKSEADLKSLGVAAHVSTPEITAALRKAGLQVNEREDVRAAVEKKAVMAGIEEERGASGTVRLKLFVDVANPASSSAGEKIRIALSELKDDKIRQSLRNSGISESVLVPFTVQRVNVAPERKMAGTMWGMLGYMLLLLMFSGGMYPVIDMTAGEKERRTLECFLTAPVARGEIVMGKILAAMTAIFLTAMLTLGSMVVSIRGNRLSSKSPELRAMLSTIPLDTNTVLLIIVTLLPLAVLAASVMIAIAMFARSFKEGQSYLTPLVLVVLFPALLGGVPGFELSPVLCLIPIFNASQLLRGIILGEFSQLAFFLTFGANLVYAAIAFVVARRRFEDESVLFRT